MSDKLPIQERQAARPSGDADAAARSSNSLPLAKLPLPAAAAAEWTKVTYWSRKGLGPFAHSSYIIQEGKKFIARVGASTPQIKGEFDSLKEAQEALE